MRWLRFTVEVVAKDPEAAFDVIASRVSPENSKYDEIPPLRGYVKSVVAEADDQPGDGTWLGAERYFAMTHPHAEELRLLRKMRLIYRWLGAWAPLPQTLIHLLDPGENDWFTELQEEALQRRPYGAEGFNGHLEDWFDAAQGTGLLVEMEEALS